LCDKCSYFPCRDFEGKENFLGLFEIEEEDANDEEEDNEDVEDANPFIVTPSPSSSPSCVPFSATGATSCSKKVDTAT
jgi:hypothetical protein